MHAFLLAIKQTFGYYKLCSIRNALALGRIPVNLHLFFACRAIRNPKWNI